LEIGRKQDGLAGVADAGRKREEGLSSVFSVPCSVVRLSSLAAAAERRARVHDPHCSALAGPTIRSDEERASLARPDQKDPHRWARVARADSFSAALHEKGSEVPDGHGRFRQSQMLQRGHRLGNWVLRLPP